MSSYVSLSASIIGAMSIMLSSLAGAADSPMGNLRWRDSHLSYEGVFISNEVGVSLSVNVFNLSDHTKIGRTDIPIPVVLPVNKSDAIVSMEFDVTRDEAFATPHIHPIFLVLRILSDKTHRLLQSCQSKTECWVAEGVVTGDAANQILRLGIVQARYKQLSAAERAKEDELRLKIIQMQRAARDRSFEDNMRYYTESIKKTNDIATMINGGHWCQEEQRYGYTCR